MSLKSRIIVNQNVSKLCMEVERNNLKKPKKENEALKDRIRRDIRTLFKQVENYYKLIRLGNFWNNNYSEYESSGNRNKNLSVK